MKYLSKYSNGKMVSAAQYITEIICEHLAKKDKKDLHYRFWLSKEWQKFYKSQIFSANKLLKNYSDRAIIKALYSEQGQKIFSLRAPHLIDIIQKQETLLCKQSEENISTDYKRISNVKGRTETKKTKSILDKLKEIDNGN
jgi:hypothetical protein